MPVGFVFAVKASRGITHYRKLVGAEEPLQTLLERVRLLEAHLGPVLYQLPPHLHRDDERLERFLELLPLDLQHAVEFRHLSWFHEDVFNRLRAHRVALCLLDMPGFTCPLVTTAPFVYVRFHGATGKYRGSYPQVELERWAEIIRSLCSPDRQAYVYFNNDENAYAVYNALALSAFLSPKPAQS